jgi:hypothetical protein
VNQLQEIGAGYWEAFGIPGGQGFEVLPQGNQHQLVLACRAVHQAGWGLGFPGGRSRRFLDTRLSLGLAQIDPIQALAAIPIRLTKEVLEGQGSDLEIKRVPELFHAKFDGSPPGLECALPDRSARQLDEHEHTAFILAGFGAGKEGLLVLQAGHQPAQRIRAGSLFDLQDACLAAWQLVVGAQDALIPIVQRVIGQNGDRCAICREVDIHHSQCVRDGRVIVKPAGLGILVIEQPQQSCATLTEQIYVRGATAYTRPADSLIELMQDGW